MAQLIDWDVHNTWSSTDEFKPWLAPSYRDRLERGEVPASFPVACRPWLHPETELPLGECRVVQCGRGRICVFNVSGTPHALLDRCPHQGAPLSCGVVSGGPAPGGTGVPGSIIYDEEPHLLRCPWHGWEYDLLSGRAMAEPRIRRRNYPSAIEDDQVVAYV